MSAITTMLENLMKSLMESTLAQALTNFMTSMWTKFTDWLWYQFCLCLYKMLRAFLNLLRLIERMFNIFAGTDDVFYMENGRLKAATLIEYLMGGTVVTRVLIYITILGAMLGFIFAIISTARSIADTAVGGEKYPLSKVLRSGLKAAIGFAWIPFFCLLIQKLSAAILTGIISAMNLSLNGGASLSLVDQIFLSVSQDALKAGADQTIISQRYFYQSLELVERYMDITKIHYGLGFLVCLPMLFILLASSLQFIRRMYDLLVLYVVSPLFTSTIALDDGETFKKWRELFVGKYFASFAAIITMRIYLLIIPTITSEDELVVSQDWLQRFLFNAVILVGGAWAVYKGQEFLMQLFVDQGTVGEAAESNAVVGGYVTNKIKSAFKYDKDKNSQKSNDNSKDKNKNEN